MLTTITALIQATQGLLVTSETDAPLELFVWPLGVPWTIERTLAALALPSSTPVEEISLACFFAPRIALHAGQPQEEVEQAQAFQRLYTLLTQQLTNLQVMRIGEIEIFVWIVGATSAGRILGLTTLLVET